MSGPHAPRVQVLRGEPEYFRSATKQTRTLRPDSRWGSRPRCRRRQPVPLSRAPGTREAEFQFRRPRIPSAILADSISQIWLGSAGLAVQYTATEARFLTKRPTAFA